MSEQRLELHRRNGLMVKLLWGCLVLGIAAAYHSPKMIMTLLSYGAPIALVCTILRWKKIWVPYTMYVLKIS